MNNQTSVSSTFVHLSPRIISSPPISFPFNLSIHLFLCALILFFFHYLPLFLSSPFLTFVFMLSAWALCYCCNCNQIDHKGDFTLSFSLKSVLIRFSLNFAGGCGVTQEEHRKFADAEIMERLQWEVGHLCATTMVVLVDQTSARDA